MYLCVAPVDGRKQAASLALLVEQSFGHNVFEPALYVFTTATRSRADLVLGAQRPVPVEQARGEAAVHLAAPVIRRDGGDERPRP